MFVPGCTKGEGKLEVAVRAGGNCPAKEGDSEIIEDCPAKGPDVPTFCATEGADPNEGLDTAGSAEAE
jgi:hypothetical protein